MATYAPRLKSGIFSVDATEGAIDAFSQDTPVTNMQRNRNEKIATRLFYIGVVMVIIVIDLLAILYAK